MALEIEKKRQGTNDLDMRQIDLYSYLMFFFFHSFFFLRRNLRMSHARGI